MRITASEMVTVDGYFEGAGGEPDCAIVGEEFERLSLRQLESASALFFRRRTYEGMARHWPSAS